MVGGSVIAGRRKLQVIFRNVTDFSSAVSGSHPLVKVAVIYGFDLIADMDGQFIVSCGLPMQCVRMVKSTK